jgi:hypothetical protein
MIGVTTMTECGQQIFGGCDTATCDRSCSRTITIHELPSVAFRHRDLAWPVFVGAVLALASLGIIAAANVGLSRAEHDYQVSRRV